jgi:hypothetical protein
MILTVVMMIYGASKGQIMLLKDKPLVSSVKEENVRSLNDTVNLLDSKFNFRLAFGVKNMNSNQPLDDPKIVEWAPYFTTTS